MKLLGLFLAGLILLIIFLLSKITVFFQYAFENFSGVLLLNIHVFFWHGMIEVAVPKELLADGLGNILSNVINDMSKDQDKPDKFAVKEKSKVKPVYRRRYHSLKASSAELFRHYLSSWPKLIFLKNRLSNWKRLFYRQIRVESLKASVRIGSRDAAETGLVAGALWAFFGLMNARIYRTVTVKKNQINYQVFPDFNKETFLFQLNCIFSLKISHIIFMAYKFLLIMINSRRVSFYGRTSN